MVRWPRLPALLLLSSAAAAHGQAAGDAEVSVELSQFGVGSAFRPGDIAAIRLDLTTSLPEPTPCWVQWEMPNAEGDIAEYGRSVTLSPGMTAPVWLYAPISPRATSQSVWTVRAFEERDGRRRQELGGARISPGLAGAQLVEPDRGMIAVVGRARMGLDEYANSWSERATPPGAHEETRIISGILPQDLPDRWEGLKPFEAVVWSDALPQQMRTDAAGALREYVRRGGHLVITLPEAGNPWGLGARGQNWLDELIVHQAPRRDEGVLVSELLPLLSKAKSVPRDFELSLRVFRDEHAGFDAIDNQYAPLLSLPEPDGRVVAVQRLVGFGRITILGVDLSSQRLASMRLPHADAFWNRVLGRRSDTPQASEVQAMKSIEPRVLTSGGANELMIGDGRLFGEHVDKAGRAGLGLFAAVFLFGGYWLLAGVGSFYMLKSRGLVRHSWIAFAATAAVFTAVAWGGVRVFREHTSEFRHVTVLDHVARPPDDPRPDELHYQRAFAWGALYSPGYGEERVSIDSEPMQQDLLLTWAAPDDAPERFPNVDRYAIDVGRSFADYRIPVRATATRLYADWMGALDPDWGGVLRVDPQDPIRVEPDPAGGVPRIRGTVIHDLPGRLDNVTILWITGTRTTGPRYAVADGAELPWVPPMRSGEMLTMGHMVALRADQPVYPGEPLSLSVLQPSGQTNLERNIYRRYIEDEEGDGYSGIPGVARGTSRLTESKRRQYLEMMGFFHQLTPPKYLRVEGKEPETAIVTRKLGREMDLSAWFTSPCLILIGYLEGPPSPVPLLVNGEQPAGGGLTIVRWIYPLPP